MALLNIGAGNKDDAFYRYKMPRMITKIEGRGNGIKTNIVNMVDIAKALGRPASYTTKYFGTELGAQSKFDEKTGTSHVNGAHETAKLAALLEVFIKKYVQCYGCGNPETEIVITRSQMITLKCAACGFLSDVDMRDKLTTFIVKNPPEQKKGSKDKKAMRRAEKERLKEGEVADEEQKKLKKEKKKGTPTSKDAPGRSSAKKKLHASDEDHSPTGSQADENEAKVSVSDGSEDDVEWQTDTSAEAARQRIQEQLNSFTAGMVIISTGEENSKSGNNSPAHDEKHKANGLRSVKSHERLASVGKDSKRVNGLKSVKSREKLIDDVKGNRRVNHKLKSIKSQENLGKLRSVNSHGSLDKLKSVKSRENLDKLKSVNSQENLVGEIKDYLKNGSPSAVQLESFLGSLSGSHQEIVDAFFEALFNEVGKGLSKEVVKKKNFLTAATRDEGSQLDLLHAIETFCEKASPEAIKEVALVLKSLYDNDVLEEEFICEWYQKGVKGGNKDSPVWKNVKPFVEWLQSAESETE